MAEGVSKGDNSPISSDVRLFQDWRGVNGAARFVPSKDDTCQTGSACGPAQDGYFHRTSQQVEEARLNLATALKGISDAAEKDRVWRQIEQYTFAMQVHKQLG